MSRIIKVLSVIDTRDYTEDGDRWIPVPGSGDAHECARCGRLHEVHAEVECEDGATLVVGTGCMKSESAEVASKIKAMDGRAKRIARLKCELATLKAKLQAREKREAEVEAMTPPALVHGTKKFYDGTDQPFVQCGEAFLWCKFDQNRDEEAIRDWRFGVLGGYKAEPAYMLREYVRNTEKQIAALVEKQTECVTAH